MQSRLVRANLALTGLFLITVAIAIPTRSQRGGQVLIAVVSLVLFAIGIGASIWAYAAALERSRVEEVGVANLYLLTGPTAPPPVKRAMTGALIVQAVAAMGGAWVGVVGLSGNQINALAFGVLVPMFGIGMNGVWAARHGSYGPRVGTAVSPTDHEID